MQEWESVCRLEQINREGGVTALVHGRALAVIRTHDDQVYALSNYDPIAHASVLARGIVGSLTRSVDGVDEDVPFIASPLLKQKYDLRTGLCLDDSSVVVPTYQVRVDDGVVVVGPRQGTIES
ncbi:nitrite reductase small subunit NirD [Nocardioides montaniterrae]